MNLMDNICVILNNDIDRSLIYIVVGSEDTCCRIIDQLSNRWLVALEGRQWAILKFSSCLTDLKAYLLIGSLWTLDFRHEDRRPVHRD